LLKVATQKSQKHDLQRGVEGFEKREKEKNIDGQAPASRGGSASNTSV